MTPLQSLTHIEPEEMSLVEKEIQQNAGALPREAGLVSGSLCLYGDRISRFAISRVGLSDSSTRPDESHSLCLGPCCLVFIWVYRVPAPIHER